MATAAQVAEYRQANQALVSLAQRDLADFWSALDVFGDPTRVSDLLVAFFPDLVQAYGDTAAVLSADWYDLLRDVPASAASFRAVTASPVKTAQAEASARWAIGPLFQAEPNPSTALSQLMGSTQRLVLQPGRESFAQSASRDPVRTGWAIVPGGATTCAFCVMLASRGAVYAEESHMGDFHDNCTCVQVLIRSKDDYPAGHDLDHYRELYREGSGVGRDLPRD